MNISTAVILQLLMLTLSQGLVNTADNSVCGSLRIYIYNLPTEFNNDVLPKMQEVATQNVNMTDIFSPYSASSQQLLEVFLHEMISSSICRVTRPEEANLFYIPVYTHALHFWPRPLTTKPEDLKQLMPLYKRLQSFLLNSTYWHHFCGADHVMVASLYLHEIQPFKEFISSSMLIVKEIQDIPWCYKPDRDSLCYFQTILAPYPINDPSAYIGNDSQRDLFLVFIGSLLNPEREQLKRWLDEDKSSRFVSLDDRFVLPFSLNMSELYRRSLFCPVLKGDTPNSKRLFHALFCGCIPVIMSDKLQLPFQLSVNYTDVVVRFPEHMVTTGEFYTRLREMPQSEILRLQHGVKQARAALNIFDNSTSHTSGLTSLYRELETRRLAISSFDSLGSRRCPHSKQTTSRPLPARRGPIISSTRTTKRSNPH